MLLYKELTPGQYKRALEIETTLQKDKCICLSNEDERIYVSFWDIYLQGNTRRLIKWKIKR